MLMNKEEFHLVVFARLSDSRHKNIHHLLVHVDGGIQIESVDQDGDLIGVISEANDKQLDELFASDSIFLGFLELLPVVLLAVHLEDNINVFSRDQETLSVVLGNS